MFLPPVCVYLGGHEPQRGTQSPSAGKGLEHQTRDGGPVHLSHCQICKYEYWAPDLWTPRFMPRITGRRSLTRSPCFVIPPPVTICLSTLHAWVPQLRLALWFILFTSLQSCLNLPLMAIRYWLQSLTHSVQGGWSVLVRSCTVLACKLLSSGCFTCMGGYLMPDCLRSTPV